MDIGLNLVEYILRVATNKSLNKIGINDSGLCDNCKVPVVTTEHFILDCQIAVKF